MSLEGIPKQEVTTPELVEKIAHVKQWVETKALFYEMPNAPYICSYTSVSPAEATISVAPNADHHDLLVAVLHINEPTLDHATLTRKVITVLLDNLPIAEARIAIMKLFATYIKDLLLSPKPIYTFSVIAEYLKLQSLIINIDIKTRTLSLLVPSLKDTFINHEVVCKGLDADTYAKRVGVIVSQCITLPNIKIIVFRETL